MEEKPNKRFWKKGTKEGKEAQVRLRRVGKREGRRGGRTRSQEAPREVSERLRSVEAY